jgi:predicted RNA-binding protein
MAEKVARLGIKRDKDHFLYVKDSKVWATPRRKKGTKKPAKTKKIIVASIAPHKMSKDHLYFIDKKGDVSRALRPNARRKKPRKTR